MAQLLGNSGLVTPRAIDNLGWMNSITSTSNAVVYRDANVFITLNTDGTYTQYWNAIAFGGLTYDASGNPTGGNINWIIHSTSASPTLPPQIERINGNNGNNLGISAAVFWSMPDGNSRFAMLFSSSDQISGNNNTDDVLTGGAGSDAFSGGTGTDTVSYITSIGGVTANLSNAAQNTGDAFGDTYSSIEHLIGSETIDLLSGTGGVNYIAGAGGADSIYGQGGADTLVGQAGADTYVFDSNQVVDGLFISDGSSAERDKLQTVASSAVDFTVASITGVEDLIIGGNGAVTLAGTQVGGAGITQVTGDAAGAEYLYVNGNSVDLSGVTFSSWTAGQDSIVITLSGANSIARGSVQAETMLGTSNSDVFYSGGGNDRIFGGDGADYITFTSLLQNLSASALIDGGQGTDRILVGALGGRVAVDFAPATITSIEEISFTTDAGVPGEAVGTFSSAQVGGTGISSTALIRHTDILASTEQAFLQFFMANGGSLNLSGFTFSGWKATDVININGTANILGATFIGSSQRDNYSGGTGADDIRSFAGNDVLDGGDGNDYLQAGTGANVVHGGLGTDQLSFYDLAGGVTFTLGAAGGGVANFASLSASFTYDGIESIAGSDYGFNILGGAALGADDITGNGDKNVIDGYWGNDTLRGMGGNDKLTGGFGNDTLDGGADRDQLFGDDGDDTIFYDAGDDLANVLGGSGTDTLVVVNGAAPTSFNLVSHGFEKAEVRISDTLNNQIWSSYVDFHTGSWQLDITVGQYDAAYANNPGGSWGRDFDQANANVWIYYQNEFTSSGALDYTWGYYDATYVNNPGGRWARDIDLTNSYEWAYYQNEFAASGLLDNTWGVYDAGAANYPGGSWARDIDLTGAYPWAWYQNEFDNLGRLSFTYGVYDTNATWQQNIDEAGAFLWASERWEFSAANVQTQHYYVMDNGSIVYL